MLDELMNDIEVGGTLEVNALARKYDTTPQLITAMLGHLERLGVVASYIDCGEGCQQCGLSADCSHKHESRMWRTASRK